MKLINVIKLSENNCRVPIRAELKYATKNNFVGRVIDGYTPGLTDIALMTPNAAANLCRVQDDLISDYGYGLLIFDAYRPKRAVMDFLSWTTQPPANAFELERKAKHYPNIEKHQLFELGYVVEDSNHCYGNTVDLVLFNNNTNELLDMGARFDFMDTTSHITTESSVIGETAVRNRMILSKAMQKFGFEPYYAEFWHFSHGGRKGREVIEAMDIAITSEFE
jgi:D-alanyl-D-alanine dipeptidase